MLRANLAVWATGLLCFQVSVTFGGPVPLELIKSWPDVYSNFIQVDYDYSQRKFTAGGKVWQYDPTPDVGGEIDLLGKGAFTLEANITREGDIQSGGSFLLDVTDGVGTTYFRSATLSEFRYYWSNSMDMFEFVFISDGSGSCAPLGVEKIGVILDGSVIPPSFTVPETRFEATFSNGGNGYADTFLVPEPGSAVLALIATAALLRRRRAKVAHNRYGS